MPQPGQTFFSSRLSGLEETRIAAVRTVNRNGERTQLLALDDAPSALQDEVLPKSRSDPIDVVPTESVREELDPAEIHQRRDDRSRRLDNQRDAEVTTDPLQWASSPNEYDYPGVDTGPTFRKNFDKSDFSDF